MNTSNQESRNYLELKIPVRKNAEWFAKLRNAMSDAGIAVKWQDGWYHITIVFVNDNNHVDQLHQVFDNVFNRKRAPLLTLDKLGTFTTRGGLQHIVYLSSSKLSEEIKALIDELRGVAKAVGANLDSEFRLHISLGRIDAKAVSMERVEKIIDKIVVPEFTLKVKEAEYRYFRDRSIQKWQMK